MTIRLKFGLFSFVAVLGSAVQAGEWEVRGRVVDEAGKPVADAAVDWFWTANGSRKHSDGTPLDFTQEQDRPAFWGSVGQMEPNSKNATKTNTEGSFDLKIPNYYHAILGMDAARTRGGVAILAKGNEQSPVEIRLQPLIKARAAFEGPETGKRPFWNHTYVELAEDPNRPLDSCRLVSCGSFEARFAVALPPGDYTINAYGESAKNDKIDAIVTSNPKLILTPDVREVDLGTWRLVPHLYPAQRIEQAKANGTCFDYKKHYGELPPTWHITEARGVSKDVKISDLKGKWVLLTFWGMNCTSCLGDELPRLMKFYEEHQAQRDQFEIISICIDYDGELKTLAEVDHALEPIVKNVWGGKTLPFPILFDPSFKTWETFGIDGMGTTILIDPDGKLVEGDEKTLAEKLK